MPNSLLLITGIFPPDSGGPAKFATEFGDWTSKSGFKVRIQSYADRKSALHIDSDFQASFVSRSQGLFLRYVNMVYRIGRGASSADVVLSIGAFLETFIASKIFKFNYVAKVPGDIVWERARNNSVTSLNIEEFQESKLNFRYKIFRALYSQSLKRAQIVIVPSQGLYRLCLGWGVHPSKIRLIYNSVEQKSTPAFEDIVKTYDLVTVCRLVPWKGVEELINFTARENKSLLVIGDGPEKSNLELISKNLKADVTFVGEVPSEKVSQLLQTSRVFVLNSYYEGLPHALVEARVAGLISVGRAGTGSAEVINDDVDGFLVREDRSLEKTIKLAFSKLSDSEVFISKARADAHARFSKEKNFETILQTLNGLTVE